MLERFYRGIYLAEFAAQREPFDAWLSALRGEQPYEMDARIVTDGDDILGGVTYELYPQSQCGLITYLVVAPHARQRGLGKQLMTDAVAALNARGARAVFGEMNRNGTERLARFQRWGCRVVDVGYVQPSLGPGLPRDRGLVLIVHPPLPAIDGRVVREFVHELHVVTERREPDAEIRAILDGIRDGEVRLVELT